MKKSFKSYFFTIVIAFVWLANGFLCKLLGLVPRHEQIVAAILGNQYATIITKMIGLSEIALGIWILIGKYRRTTAVFQIVIVLTMNVLEFLLAPHLLLWGQFNILFAILFCLLIYFYAFGIKTPNMLPFLKNHPFAVEAYFKRLVVLTFAVPKEALTDKIPPCLQLDVFDDKWAFIAVAMVHTSGLRPKGFPEFCGNNFFLTGYRIFVRYTTASGKKLRGLYIIKSETNSKKMEFFGNIFTKYNYTTTDIITNNSDAHETIASLKSGFCITIKNDGAEIPLPTGSPFADWKQARRYAGPLPFTFTYDAKNKEVLIIEGVRQNWQPQPLDIESYQFRFLDSLNIDGVALANAFEITNIPYYWKKGRKEIWKQ